MTDSFEFKQLKKYFKRKSWNYEQSILDNILQEMKKRREDEIEREVEILKKRLELLRK